MADNGWAEFVLDDVAADVTVGHVGSMASEYVETGVPFLRSKNVEPFGVDWNDMRYVSPGFHQRLKKSALSPGDVVIVRTGKPGTAAVIPNSLPEANCSDLVIVRPGPDLDARYLVYYLNSLAVHHVNAHLVGAVQQHFNVSSARKLRMRLPPLPEQKAIAHILGTLDDKIELNGRMNATLEGMARALFKSWFVDFDPVRDKIDGRQPQGLDPETAKLFPDRFEESELGKIPKGWGIHALRDIAELRTQSVSPARDPKKLWEHYSIPAFDESRRPARELGNNIKSNKYIVPDHSVLVSKLNPQFPRIWMPDVLDADAAICSTEFMPFVPAKVKWRSFLFELAQSEPFKARS